MRRLHRPPCPNPEALKKNYKHPENKKALQDASYGKCMYCESQVSHVYFGDVEHIKPKAANKHPELEFEWTNLGYCCARCNNAKNDQYEGECPLIDPYSEEPSEHLVAFGSSVWHRQGSERGELTIRVTDLNRADLIERRAIMLKSVQDAIDACYRTRTPALRKVLLVALGTQAADDKEFSMFARALLSAHTPD
ncbi:HNH endonuclease [Xanthomonas sacchari]|nr:HNH endonuclease [Xanthomonas sacchari]